MWKNKVLWEMPLQRELGGKFYPSLCQCHPLVKCNRKPADIPAWKIWLASGQPQCPTVQGHRSARMGSEVKQAHAYSRTECPRGSEAILNSNQGWSCQKVTFEQISEDEREESIGRSEENIPGREIASIKALQAGKTL